MLAERVLRLETALYQPEFAAWPPDERLAAEFHRRICHDRVPDIQTLEAADRSDWQPLMAIWQLRFTSAPKTP